MRQAGQMASQAVDLVAAAAGSNALADGQRMQRYLRDVATYKTHVNAQHGSFATLLGATLLGAEAAA
jgi:3-hydroxy-9,10-secoandrosta-1,3,5(10)-triene-9,17-dione monooxygenase